MEGIPDHHEPQAFTGRRSRWSRQLSHTPKKADEGRAHREWKRERRQGCQRLDRSRAPWEDNAHARRRSRPTTCEARGQVTQRISECCVLDDPPKRFERRESARSPGQAARSPNSGRRPRSESCGSVAGNVRGAGARSSFGWQKSIRRVVRLAHREVASPRGEETWQGASQKEARSLSDARHEWVEGETVRGRAQTIKSRRSSGLWVSARRFSRRRKAFSGSGPSHSHRWDEVWVLWLAGQTRSIRALKTRESPVAHRAVRKPTRACLRATTRVSEIDTVR